MGMRSDGSATVHTLDLRRTAAAIARTHAAAGAVVIVVAESGDIRLGAESLTPQELRDAACTLIRASFQYEEREPEIIED